MHYDAYVNTKHLLFKCKKGYLVGYEFFPNLVGKIKMQIIGLKRNTRTELVDKRAQDLSWLMR